MSENRLKVCDLKKKYIQSFATQAKKKIQKQTIPQINSQNLTELC